MEKAEKYYLAPDVHLSKDDEKYLTAFIWAHGMLDEVGVYYTLDFSDGTSVSFGRNTTTIGKNNGKTRPVEIFTNGKQYFLRLYNLDERTRSFKEIEHKKAHFFIMWMSFIHKIDECKKIKKEIEKISDYRRKKNGMSILDKKKDPQFCEMMEGLHKLHQEKHEIRKTSKFEEVARCQDKINELRSQVIKYLLKNYPKRKILKSKFIEDVLNMDVDNEIYTFQRLY